MERLTTNKMVQPQTNVIDWTTMGVVWTFTIGVITVVFKWIDSYFAHKKQAQEVFIRNLVVATVTSTMEGCLRDINEKVNKLFEYREADRNHLDEKFNNMTKEIRK
jgi:hypothetical protein